MRNDFDPAFASRLRNSQTSRRRFLTGTVIGAATVFVGPSVLAACASSGSPGTSTTPTPDDGAPATGALRVSNWPLYIADGFVADFQKASGLTVDYMENYNDDEEWFAKN